ncbi:MAG: hypothetical protein KDJ49_07650 [Alphaproteobacteria bacterium]|nr:hypothetical protein [Alphaproteobacteria bacterium]
MVPDKPTRQNTSEILRTRLRTPFTLPDPSIPGGVLPFLEDGYIPTEAGFTKPVCRDCHACIPLRLPLADFVPDGEFRKTAAHNDMLKQAVFDGLPRFDHNGRDPFSRLYTVFQNAVHEQGYAAHRSGAYFNYLSGYVGTDPFYITLRDAEGGLRGVVIAHGYETAAYGTQFFYDPALRQQGIGQALVLRLIAHLQEHTDMKYLYFGFWTNKPGPLSWKSKFLPMEFYLNGEWVRVDSRAGVRALRDPRFPAQPAARVS